MVVLVRNAIVVVVVSSILRSVGQELRSSWANGFRVGFDGGYSSGMLDNPCPSEDEEEEDNS